MDQEKQNTGYRRARVNRLKRMIVAFVLTAWIVPVLLSIYVLFSLQKQQQSIARLERTIGELSKAQNSQAAEPVLEETQAVEETIEQVTFFEESEAALEEFAGHNETEASVVEAPAEEIADQTENLSQATKRIYLTFDDGPSVYTQEICDILAKYQIKATFFVNGKEGEWADQALQRIVEDGHTLGMHSYSHVYDDIYHSVENFAADYEKIHEHIYQVTGYDSHVYRFPGGSSNAKSQLDMQVFMAYLETKDTVFFDWNISSQDATSEKLSVMQIVANCTRNISKFDDCVILCHDAQSKSTTVEALPLVIEKIMETEGVEFLPLTTQSTPVQHISMDAQN